MKLGQKLRQLRKRKNLSAEQLSQLSKVNQMQIWFYENGTRTPTLENLLKIAKALNISLMEFQKTPAKTAHHSKGRKKRNNASPDNSGSETEGITATEEHPISQTSQAG